MQSRRTLTLTLCLLERVRGTFGGIASGSPNRDPRRVRSRFSSPRSERGETSEVVRQRIFHFLLTVLSRFHDQPGVGFQAPLLKSAYVAGLVVRLPFLPHSPHDPLPLVGQLSHRFVVAHPPFEILITTSRPLRELDRAGRKFMPGLAQKFRTAPAHMHPVLGASA